MNIVLNTCNGTRSDCFKIGGEATLEDAKKLAQKAGLSLNDAELQDVVKKVNLDLWCSDEACHYFYIEQLSEEDIISDLDSLFD